MIECSDNYSDFIQIYRHCNVKIFSSINVFIIYMSYTSCKWSTIFKFNISICITICSCYISCNKNTCIWIIADWLNIFCLKFSACTIFISFTTVYTISIMNKILFFLLQILKIYYQCHLINVQSFEFPLYIWSIMKPNESKVTAFWKFKSYFFWFFNDKEHCSSIILIKYANKVHLLF